MTSKIGFLANLRAGYKLEVSIAARARKSQAAISTMVLLDTNGSGISTSRVVIVPSAIPAAQLGSETSRFCSMTILTIVLGLAPIALRIPSS